MNGVPIRPEVSTTSLNQSPTPANDIPEKHLENVTKGKVMVKKPNVGQKVLSEFLEQDANDIKEYVWRDVMIPTIKDTLCNIVELLLFGSASRGRRGGSHANDQRTNYSSYYYSSGRGGRDERRDRNKAPRSLDSIIFETRMDTEEVIAQLEESLERYGSVSVADLYDACGVTGDYTDNKWGWRRGARFYVRRVRDGYSIDMPKPELLD